MTMKMIRHLVVALLLLTSRIVVADGDFDPSFNRVGFTRDFLGVSSFAYGLAVHSTGEIVTGGAYRLGSFTENLVLWRHLPDGTLDATFGGTGVVYPPFTPPNVAPNANSLAIDSRDRIVLLTEARSDLVFYRFNFDGTPDLTFSAAGSTTIPIGPSIYGVTGLAIQPDNKVIGVCGAINPGTGRYEFVTLRLQEDGTLDPTFGGSGLLFTPITPGGGQDIATGIAIQPDGKIVVAGRGKTLLPGAYYDAAIARYSSTGTLDSDFGTDGKVSFSILDDDFIRKVVIQPDGQIVVAGSICRDLGGGSSYCYLGAARIDDSGTLDPNFGSMGTVYTDVGDLGGNAYDLALQADNRILVVGIHQFPPNFSFNSILIRYLPNGSLDPMFGLNGISETGYGYVRSGSGDVRLQSDGQILVTGGTNRGGIDSFATAVTARYLAGPNGFGAASRVANTARASRMQP